MASLRCRQDIAIAALHLIIDDYHLASSRHDCTGRMKCQLGDRAACRDSNRRGLPANVQPGPKRTGPVAGAANLGDPSIKNETLKKALGDRRQEWRFHCQIPHAETKPHLLSAPS